MCLANKQTNKNNSKITVYFSGRKVTQLAGVHKKEGVTVAHEDCFTVQISQRKYHVRLNDCTLVFTRKSLANLD